MNTSRRTECSPQDMNHVTQEEFFLPYHGTTSDLKEVDEFRRIIGEHDFVLITAGVTYCKNNRKATKNTRTLCEKGVAVSTYNW